MSATDDTHRPSRRLIPRVKRWTILVHLYLGVAFCGLFAVWFASGVVMMYQSYPTITVRDKLRVFAPLQCTTCRITPAALVARAPDAANSPVFRLGMLGATPVWRFIDDDGHWAALDAASGLRITALDTMRASEVALLWRDRHADDPQGPVRAVFRGLLREPDQWTLLVAGQLPLLRFDLTDAAGTRVYLAPQSGEVLAASTRRARGLTWIGAIPHWIFPTMLRRHESAWEKVIVTLSALGTILSVAGLAIGIWQWRWRLRRTRTGTAKPRTPYRDFVLRWHHMLGLLFGTFVCTWVFSGLMSMNPAGWSPGIGATRAQRLHWQGGERDLSRFVIPPESAWRQLRASGHAPRELVPVQVSGRPYWIGYEADGATAVVAGDSAGAVLRAVPSTGLPALAATLVPGASVFATDTLDRYDSYYYDTARQLPLPVVRLQFDDAARTWLYIDPATGSLAQRRQWKNRLERWLYTGLHDLDFEWLRTRRPLWDAVLITLSFGGLLCSLTGGVMAVRWIGSLRPGKPRPPR